jgi:uroporphyrin-3 C-methyltransferase
MSDDDPKPGVVIDVEPEPNDGPQGVAADRSAAGEPPSAPATQRAGLAGRLGFMLGMLALLSVAALGLVGFGQVRQLEARIAGLDGELQASRRDRQALQEAVSQATEALNRQSGTLDEQQAILARQRAAVETARTAFEAQERRLADENLRLQEREAELRAAVADVHRRVGRSGSHWIVAEVEYLLRIAAHRLDLARDTETAIVALELADQRLGATQDPGWAGVRAQLARDIAALGAYATPDLAGLAARLGALIDQVPQLTVARAAVGPDRSMSGATARSPEERSWDTLLDDLLAGFKGAVRIRERGQPVAAMLAPEHQFFLYENMKLRLEAARLALARGDQASYLSNLETATRWLTDHFSQDAIAAAMQASLASLHTIDVAPALPDISQSLRALQVRRQLLGDVLPRETAVAPSPDPTTTP